MKRISIAAGWLGIGVLSWPIYFGEYWPAYAQTLPQPTLATIAMNTPLCVSETVAARCFDKPGRQLKDGDQVDELGEPCSKKKPDGSFDSTACPSLTLGRAARNALCAGLKEDATQPGEQRAARCAFGDRIKDNPAVVLKKAERDTIMARIGLIYPAMVSAQAFALLDPNAELPEVK